MECCTCEVKLRLEFFFCFFPGTHINQINFKNRRNYVVNDFNELVTKLPSFKEIFAGQ